MEDGIYFELFTVQHGIRFHIKFFKIRELYQTVIDKVLEGLYKITELPEVKEDGADG